MKSSDPDGGYSSATSPDCASRASDQEQHHENHHHHHHRFHLHLPHIHYRRILHRYFEQVHIYHPKWLPRGSTVAATANMMAATIGVGTLSMPYAASEGGVAMFVALVVVTLTLGWWATYILCRLVDLHQVHSFELLTRTIFQSHNLEIFIEVFIVIDCLGGAVAYVVVIGDISQAIFSAIHPSWSGGVVRVVAQCSAFALVLLPLSLLRTLGALKYASTIGVMAIFLLVFVITAQALNGGTQSNFSPQVGTLNGILSSLPFLFFAFGNQINAVEIYSELRNRSPWAFGKVINVGVGLVGVASLIVGLSGLSLFGSGVAGNVLSSMNPNNPSTVMSLIGVGLKVVLSFPLLMYPCREALLHMVGVEDVRNASTKVHVISTSALAGVALGLAIVVPQVSTLFGLIGSLCGSLFSFIVPAVLGLKSDKYWEGLPSATLHRSVSYVLIVVGIFVAISGTYFSALSI